MTDRHNVVVSQAEEARFWEKVERLGSDACWPWKAALNSSGYGSFGIGGKTFAASQIALVLSGRPRPSPPNDHALHSCDNRACVNPSHLRWGTHQENMKERGERCIGFNKGPRQYGKKLTERQVLEVLRSQKTGLALAADLGVCKQTISDIRRRITWGHLSP